MGTELKIPRRRSLEIEGKAAVPTALVRAVKDFYLHNKIAKAEAKLADAAKATVFSGMKEGRINAVDATIVEPDGKVELRAEFGTSRGVNVVDMTKLRKLVRDDEKLLSLLLSNGVGRPFVVEHFGEAMANQVCSFTPGGETLKIGPRG